MKEEKLVKLETLEKFTDKFDYNLSGVIKCCSFLDLEEADMKIIRRSIKILDRYRESIYNCVKLKEYKHILDVDEIMEAYRRKSP